MSRYQSYASPHFRRLYDELPVAVQRAADKQFALFEQDPSHPSLHLKPVGAVWGARVTGAYRALAVREGDTFYWFWIGSHDEYRRLYSTR